MRPALFTVRSHPAPARLASLVPTLASACLLAACGGGGDASPPGDGFTLGGTASGLDSGKRLVLQNKGSDDLAITANGAFTFAARLPAGGAYEVTVKTQPSGQSCSVRHGSGTLAGANVSDVEVACATSAASLPDGLWKQDLCVLLRPGAWGRGGWRISRQSDSRVNLSQTLVQYDNAQCAGTGAPQADATPLGTIVFDRNGATATLTAYWGLWTQPSGLSSRTVWALKGTRLCALGDSEPSLLPTLDSVASAADLSIAGQSCYTPL